MASKVNVNGKLVSIPGIYSVVKSGVKNAPLGLLYGNILIIDNGRYGATWGGGSGIAGTLHQDKESVYEFETIQEFRNFVKGGYWWHLAYPLFRPFPGLNGVSKIFYVRASETTQATVTYTFENGELIFKTVDEGEVANGEVTSSILTKGYGVKLVPGVIDTSKYRMQFYVGTFRGTDSINNVPYELTAANSAPALFLTSPELSSIDEFADWMQTDEDFKSMFVYTSHTNSDDGDSGVLIPGLLEANDLVTNAGFNLAAGATETYNLNHLQTTLEQVASIDYTFILSEDAEDNAQSSNNALLLDHILYDAKHEKFLMLGGGRIKSKFKSGVNYSSADTAEFYDSDKVIVVHGGPKKKKKGSSGFLLYDTLYKAAVCLGRICGLAPQDAATYKTIDIDGEQHVLTDKEKEYALDKGILYSYFDDELNKHVMGQGINTLQNNEFIVNEDGTSYSIAIRRMTAQLNREISYNAKKTFFGKNEGPNRLTVTEQDLKTWLEGFLSKKVDDKLIVKFGNITVSVSGDNYFVNYEFVPNFEISKMVFTGTLLEK